MPVSSFDGVNQFDGGDDVTDDDDDDRDVEIVHPVVSDVDSIPQFDGAGDLIELDTPVKTTTTPLAPGGTSVLTGIVCLYFRFVLGLFVVCLWFGFLMTLWVCVCVILILFQSKRKSMHLTYGSECGLTAGIASLQSLRWLRSHHRQNGRGSILSLGLPLRAMWGGPVLYHLLQHSP